MGKKVYSEDLNWALARPDAHQMCRDLISSRAMVIALVASAKTVGRT